MRAVLVTSALVLGAATPLASAFRLHLPAKGAVNRLAACRSCRARREGVRVRGGFYDVYADQAVRQLEQLSLPIFDPGSDKIPFPFPMETEYPERTTYTFNQSPYLDMLPEVVSAGYFGHLVRPANGTDGESLAGAVGITCRVLECNMNEDGTEGSLVCVPGVRFQIIEVESSEPYAVASVRKLSDEPYAKNDTRLPKAMEMEGQAFQSLVEVVKLAGELERRGKPASPSLQGQALRDAALRMSSFRDKAMQCPAPHLRHEYLGLMLADLLALSFEDSVKCFLLTDSFKRLEALAEPVKDIAGELRTMLSLVDQPKVARPIESGQELEVGARIEYYETEKGVWHPGTLMAYDMTEDDVFMWDVEFDNGHTEELRCDMQTRHKWRIVEDAPEDDEAPPLA